MNPDVVIPILAFIMTFISLLVSRERKGAKVASGIIGLLLMGFTIYQSLENSENAKATKESLSELIESRRVDSINNVSFQTFLRDTFGIIKNNDTSARIFNIYRYQTHYIKEKADTEYPDENRRVTDQDLSRIEKKIPKDYVIQLSFAKKAVNEECYSYGIQLKNRLIMLGYKQVNTNEYNGLENTGVNRRFDLNVFAENKTANIIVIPLADQ